MWRVDPTVHSELFNVSGLAHKVVFQSELFFAEADKNLDQFPLYDRVDDSAVIHFRRRFIDDTFGGTPFVDDAAPAHHVGPIDDRQRHGNVLLDKEGLNALPASCSALAVLLERHAREAMAPDRFVVVLTGRR